MIALTVAEIAAVLGADLIGPGDRAAVVTAVVVDSRRAGPGVLFVALPGEHVDGHDYVAGAVERGAAAALTARGVPGALTLVVADPLVGFAQLARHLVDRGRSEGLQVVGITGSQGKTSTKDLLAQVLEAAGPTVAPVGNLNNELGVPLTVTGLTPETAYLVAEMGARGRGHIAYLCEIAPPSVGVVLNVGQAHLGEFGSQQAIAEAKGELVESLPVDGWAVLNADDPLVWAMRSRTRAQILAFAVGGPPTDPAARRVWASELTASITGTYGFWLHTSGPGESQPPVEVQLQVVGRHQVSNATAAAAAAVAVGRPLNEIAAALSVAGPRSRWRMELGTNPTGALVVNDAYNANPDSMRAAISTAVELARGRGGRTVAVLGDMLELGPQAESEHAGLGAFAARAGVDRLLVIGDFAGVVVAAARAGGLGDAIAVANKQAATGSVLAALAAADVVLVKASRGLTLDTVAEQILRQPDPAAPAANPVPRNEDRP